MDPESLTLGALVAGLVAKSVDTASGRLVSAAATALSRLRERLRRRFTDEGDVDGVAALERVEDAPDSPSRLSNLGEAVDRHTNDETFRAELEALASEAQRTIAGTLIQQKDPHNSPAIGNVRGDVHLVYETTTSSNAVCACGRQAAVLCTTCQGNFCRRHVSEPLDIPAELSELERRYYTGDASLGGDGDDHLPSREQAIFARVFYRPDREGVVVCKVCRLEAAQTAIAKLPPRPPLPTGQDPASTLAALEDFTLLRFYSTQELNEARARVAETVPTVTTNPAKSQRQDAAGPLAKALAAVAELQASGGRLGHRRRNEGDVVLGAIYSRGRFRVRLTGWADGHSVHIPRRGSPTISYNGRKGSLEAFATDPDAKGIFGTLAGDIRRYLEALDR